jgi:hypothetical protein
MSLVETPSGLLFDLLHPDPGLVRLDDIAWNLSRTCRFNASARFFYSVADHCVYVGNLLPPVLRIYGLLHDAHEAYLGDITSPVKGMIGTERIREIEKPIDAAIYEALGLPPPTREVLDLVHEADVLALRIEAYHLLPSRGYWAGNPEEFESGSHLPLVLSTAFEDSESLWKGEVRVWTAFSKNDTGIIPQ